MPPDVSAQTHLVFKNLARIVSHAGFELADTVFARVYLTNFERDYPAMNAIYSEYFPDDARLPGRTTVGVTARVDYAFTPTLSLQLYAEPFVSAGQYGDFKQVADPGAV